MPIVLAGVVLPFCPLPRGLPQGRTGCGRRGPNRREGEQKAQATPTVQDNERAQLALIPLPYQEHVRGCARAGGVGQSFISVGPEMISMRITFADANPSTVGEGTMLRPAAPRRQELQLRPADLRRRWRRFRLRRGATGE